MKAAGKSIFFEARHLTGKNEALTWNILAERTKQNVKKPKPNLPSGVCSLVFCIHSIASILFLPRTRLDLLDRYLRTLLVFCYHFS